MAQTVVRAGYGINYNLAQYGVFIRNFAFQPPFAETSTNISSFSSPLTLENGFPGTIPGEVTNNYALDPNYRLPYVQIWNLDIQRQLPMGIQLNVGYNGSKGTRLDTERALVAGRAAVYLRIVGRKFEPECGVGASTEADGKGTWGSA